ncbi:protein-lysine N-methyltransferase EEF2KMT isoform 1-T1 [Salvelinus alpinus]
MSLCSVWRTHTSSLTGWYTTVCVMSLCSVWRTHTSSLTGWYTTVCVMSLCSVWRTHMSSLAGWYTTVCVMSLCSVWRTHTSSLTGWYTTVCVMSLCSVWRTHTSSLAGWYTTVCVMSLCSVWRTHTSSLTGWYTTVCVMSLCSVWRTHVLTDRLVHYCVCYVIVFCLENTHIFTGRTVLELGCGVGLTGIAVCRSCYPSSYVFSDCHLSVLHRLRDNIQLNGLDNQNSPRVCVEHLDWEEVTEKQLREIRATTVIAADIVYDPDIIGCLVKLLSKILRCSANGSPPDVYISSTIRNTDTYNSFKHQLESSGIQHEVMTGPVTHVLFYNRQATIEMIKLYI